MSQSHFFKPCSNPKDDNIQPQSTEAKSEERSLDIFKDSESQRIINTFYWLDWQNTIEFEPEQIDKKLLGKLVYSINAATIHFSGNCFVLACATLYALKRGKLEICIGNISPFYVGAGPVTTSYIFFDKYLNTKNMNIELKGVVTELLDQFKLTKEKFFIIGVNYKLFGKWRGHAFNAVIIDNQETPEVIFLDAWKTSHPIYSIEEMADRYKECLYFSIMTIEGVPAAIKRIPSEQIQIKTENENETMLLLKMK